MNSLQLSIPTLEEKIIIEAAHIYTYEHTAPEHLISAQIGASISQYFHLLGAKVEHWLFIDNYNHHFENKPEILDLQDHVHKISEQGWKPHHLVFEKDLVTSAHQILETLLKEQYAKEHSSGAIILAKGNILLYDPHVRRYSCSLLDASLYIQKLSTSSTCITVLPQEYHTQQCATKLILKKLGVDTKDIHSVYFEAPSIHASVSSKSVFADLQVQFRVKTSELSPGIEPSTQVSAALSFFNIFTKLGGVLNKVEYAV